MRKIFWQMMTSLDGYMEGPNQDLSWHMVDDDFQGYVNEMLASIGGIILGRVTYEFFAQYWPTAAEPETRMMNELPKYVFSRTLDRVTWNNSRLVKGEMEDEVIKLKQQPGKDLAMFGSANLASSFIRLGLIDEYRMFIAPVVLGDGGPTFKFIDKRFNLKLAGARPLASGVVILSYTPAP